MIQVVLHIYYRSSNRYNVAMGFARIRYFMKLLSPDTYK